MRIRGYPLSIALLCIAAGLVGGCAGGKSNKEAGPTGAKSMTGASTTTGAMSTTGAGPTTGAAPTTRAAGPDVVYVGPFELGSSVVKSDPGLLGGRRQGRRSRQKDPVEELEHFEKLMVTELVKDLNAAGQPAQELPAGAGRPGHGWLVSGEFLELQEGNRVKRAVIGFGVGGTDAKLYVKLADLARPAGEDLLNFNAAASSGQKAGGAAGAAVTHSPWGMAAKFVMEGNASDKDIQKVAKQIAGQIVGFVPKA